MKVTVHYMAHLKGAAGIGSEAIECDTNCRTSALVQLVAARHNEALRRLLVDGEGRLQPTILLFVNDRQVAYGEDLALKDGDEISFLSPIAGG
jgi:molybdopterin converting factor small subunit